MTITLRDVIRDVIEVYVEKLRDLQRKIDEAEEEAQRNSVEYQRAWDERSQAMQRIKRCRGKECRALASEYEDEYPYRGRQ